MKHAESDIDDDLFFFAFFSGQHHQNMYKCSAIYFDHKFYITTLIGPKQVLDHNFIWMTTSFTSPLYLDHIKFSIITLLGSRVA